MSVFPDNHREMFEQESGLEKFIIQVPTVPSTADGQAVKALLDQYQDIEGVVVTENNSPVGLIMRTAFFQKTGSLYGHSLYMERPVDILMDTEIMKVDVSANVSATGIRAMNRKQNKLYDYIIVCNDKTYLGVISIRMFLVELSQSNEAQISVLKDQQQKLLNAHKQEIKLRQTVEYQSASVRNLLDHADQGFLWFGEDLIIKDEYSYKCVCIFNRNIEALSYPDLVSPYFEEEKKEVFRLGFDSYFNNNSPVTDHVFLMLLPSDCVINGKNIHIEYRRIESDGEKAVMVILNDVTEKVSMEKALIEDQNKQRLLVKAFSYQAQMQEMLAEFRALFSGGYREYFSTEIAFQAGLNELFRAVHTYKGDFAQYGLTSAAEQIHLFENALFALADCGGEATVADVERIMADADPEAILAEDLKTIYEVLGDSYFSQSEMISLPKARLAALEQQLQNTSPPPDIETVITLVKELRYKNIKLLLEQYRDYLQYLAERVMKNMPAYLIEGDEIAIDPDRYSGLIKSLVHIFRNIMDHGIETDEERVERGKGENGVVECRISQLDDRWFMITISDDGRGINSEKIKKKAMEHGLHTAEELEQMSESEIYGLIMADRFSTKDGADGISGRGVGMAAVKEACTNLGGTIEIASKENEGTSFIMKLPYIV